MSTIDLPASRGRETGLHRSGLAHEDSRRTRLRAAIIEAESVLDNVRRRLDHCPEAPPGLFDHLLSIHAEACVAERAGNFTIAYECVKRIRREQVWVMTDAERNVEFLMATVESGHKLNEWRTQAAKAMAALDEGRVAPSVEVLQGLMRNLDESQQNRQHKIELVQEQVKLISVLLVAAVIGIALLAAFDQLQWVAQSDRLPMLSTTLPGALACGFLGGLLSVAFGTIKTNLSASIQDIRSSWILTVARPFLGAAVAVPILLFLQTGFITAEKVTPALLLSLCFVGGFSERWFLSQIERVSAK